MIFITLRFNDLLVEVHICSEPEVEVLVHISCSWIFSNKEPRRILSIVNFCYWIIYSSFYLSANKWLQNPLKQVAIFYCNSDIFGIVSHRSNTAPVNIDMHIFAKNIYDLGPGQFHFQILTLLRTGVELFYLMIEPVF